MLRVTSSTKRVSVSRSRNRSLPAILWVPAALAMAVLGLPLVALIVRLNHSFREYDALSPTP